MEGGSKGTASYVSEGLPVQVIWQQDCNAGEISFTIKNGDGVPMCTVENASMLSDGQVLYEGYLCVPACAATIGSLNWTANTEGTQYTVTWDSENAVSYEVAVVQIGSPTKEDLNKAAKAVSAKQYQFNGTNHAYYAVYVRGVCADGDKGAWNSIIVCNSLTLSAPIDLKAVAETISLDHIEKGEFMKTAIGLVQGSGDPYPSRVYHLTLTDSTDVNFSMVSSDIYEHVFVIYQDTLVGKPLATITYLQSGTFKLKGDFYILFETNRQFGNYTIKIQKPKEFVFKSITNPFFEEGDFTDAADFDFHGPFGFGATPSVGYQFTPSDTIYLRIQTMTSNTTGGTGIFMFRNSFENMMAGQPLGSGSLEFECLKDTTYYIILTTLPMYGGNLTDTYSIRTIAIPRNPEPTETHLIALDALVEDSFDENDLVNELGVNGKVYEFVLKSDATLAFSIELLGEHADDPLYRNYVGLTIYRDAIGGYEVDDVYAYEAEVDQDSGFTGSASGTHYFVVVSNDYGVDAEYRFTLRALANPDKLPIKKTVNVGEGYRSSLSLKDKYSESGIGATAWYGAIQAYKVHLEKDKTYKFFAHVLPEGHNYYDNFQITLFDPTVTSGSFYDHILTYTYDWEDSWEVFEVTPSLTADYTMVFGAPVDNPTLADSLIFEFEVAEVMDFSDFAAAAPYVITGSYDASGSFHGNPKLLSDPSMNFHASASSYIEYYGAFDAIACQIKVAAGDTLFVEFGGAEDAMIHIYDTEVGIGVSNPVIINEIPYDYPYEYGFVVNDDTDSTLYYVLGSFVNVSLHNGNFGFRVTTSEKDLAPVVVSAKTDKNSVTIFEGEGIAAAQVELGQLVIDIVNGAGDLVTRVDNNPFGWQVDLDARTARYELNNSDLPLGFVFAEPTVYLDVTIKVIKPTDIENVEDNAIKSEEVRKIMRNGHILIVTPNGTFDMFGRKVE